MASDMQIALSMAYDAGYKDANAAHAKVIRDEVLPFLRRATLCHPFRHDTIRQERDCADCREDKKLAALIDRLKKGTSDG